MKRTLVLSLFLCIFGIPAIGQYVTLEGRQFKDENGDDFYPVVCNYLATYLFHDTTSFFVSPENQSDGWWFQCSDGATCDSQFLHNFQQLRHMGFNTIRLFSAGPMFVDTVGTPKGFRINATNHDPNSNDTTTPPRHFAFFLDSAGYSDDNSKNIFKSIDRIIGLAHDAQLKVILVCAEVYAGVQRKFYPDFPDFYIPYLQALASHIENESPSKVKEALLAYDLYNEPLYSRQAPWPDNSCEFLEKSDICQHSAGWYNALTSEDTNHLITLNGSQVADIFVYDLSLLKVDFYSPHIYPQAYSYEGTQPVLSKMLDRVQGLLLWLSKNSPMPFLIGETGFPASPGIIPPALGTLGDTAAQRQYAIQSLEMNRFYSGSGYSWWWYQDGYWGTADDYMGLLQHGDGNPPCDPPCCSLEKSVVKVFKNFDPQAPLVQYTPPANYYDPGNHEIYSNNTNIITGHVQDQNGDPIKDAVIFGYTCLYFISQDDNMFDYNCTFSDSLGSFSLIPYDYHPTLPNDNRIVDLTISAPGCSRIHRGWATCGQPSGSVQNNQTYTLQRNYFGYDNQVSDVTVQTGMQKQFQGWNSLTLNAVNVQPLASADFRARTEVNVIPGFDGVLGSEVHIYNEKTFSDCLFSEDADHGSTKLSYSSRSGDCGIADASIEIQFLFDSSEESADIIPNPNNGLFELVVSESLLNSELVITDMVGKVILSQRIFNTRQHLDLREFKGGVYCLRIVSEKKSISKKVIINR